MLPIIVVCLFASYIYKYASKVVPQVIRSFFVPLITLVISMPIGFLIIGPVVNYAADLILGLFTGLVSLSPVIAGAIMGAFFEVLVVFGMHSVIVLAAMADVLSGNPNFFMAATCLICFSQAAVVLAVYLKTKDKKTKEIALPAFISAIFGITESAVYGVTLPRPKMFAITCLGGAVTGLLLGIFGENYYIIAGDGYI